MRPSVTLAVCAALGFAAAIPLGFGRFSYALVLPAMQADLQLSYAQAGALNSANALGHLLGALLAMVLVARTGLAAAVIAGTLLTTATIAATGLATEFEWLMLWRFLPGLTGAIAFVAGGALAAQMAATLPSRASLGIGLFYAGPGTGMILAAALVAPWLAADSTQWPQAWLTMGGAAIVLSAITIWGASRASRQPPTSTTTTSPGKTSLLPALLGYGFFAAGYVGYMTFIIANVNERAASPLAITGWWAILGVGVIGGAWGWSGYMLRSRDGTALATLIGLTGIATIMPVVIPNDVGFTLSFALFGAVFLSTVAATTNLVRIARPSTEQTRWIGLFTVVFGIGQIVGPVATGVVADWLETTDSVLVISFALLAIGALVARFQKTVD